MASDLLHIKDGYYFEVPTFLWRSHKQSVANFPEWLVRLDPDFQEVEADSVVVGLGKIGVAASDLEQLKPNWETWKHASHKNEGWSLHGYLDLQLQDIKTKAKNWAAKKAPRANDSVRAFLAEHPETPNAWFLRYVSDPNNATKWEELKGSIKTHDYYQKYLKSDPTAKWDEAKIGSYNRMLDGKIMIPQPFGTLRNAYDQDSGFAISRYMLIEVVVAIIMFAGFRWLAKKIQTGESPKGKLWNMLEGMVVGVKDGVVVQAMGEHDAPRFMPFLWTIFFFILGCNLMGMIPWVGSPTASFGTTAGLALLVFIVGLFVGIQAFGVVGYLKNVCPELGLPWYLAIVVVPLLWVIEFASLFIKHIVLAVRLVMNMAAGHLVLLGILGIGISAEAVLSMNSFAWLGIASVSVLGTTILSVLELFVAFLQAFVFTFLAALFIGSSIHHH